MKAPARLRLRRAGVIRRNSAGSAPVSTDSARHTGCSARAPDESSDAHPLPARATHPRLSRVDRPRPGRRRPTSSTARRRSPCAPRDVLFEPGTPCAGLPLLVARPHPRLAAARERSGRAALPGRARADLRAVVPRRCCRRRCTWHAASRSRRSSGVIIPGATVHAWLRSHAPFRDLVLTTVAARVAGLVSVVEQAAAGRLDERLAHLLVERGPVLCVTHQALADELGTAREVVSRILEGFETHGAVRLRRGRVEVVDRSRLTPPPRADDRAPGGGTPRRLTRPGRPERLRGGHLTRRKGGLDVVFAQGRDAADD